MSELRKGQKVRVTIETVVVSEPEHEADWIVLRNPAPSKGDLILGLQTVTIEPIEDLRPGDVYRTAYGSVVCYVDRKLPYKPWLVVIPSDDCVNHGDWLLDQSVERPLTLLVRDGQPVTS